MKTNTFTLKSNELGGQLSDKQYNNGMGFSGENRSPQLYWENSPAGTESFAVTMYDLDAPTGSGFWHWVVLNIPADVRELAVDAGNPAKQLLPKGSMQTVYALSKKMELEQNTSPAIVGFNMHFATLAKASLLCCGLRSKL